jgi:hypothetical protein
MIRPKVVASLSSWLLVIAFAACSDNATSGGGGACADYSNAVISYLERCEPSIPGGDANLRARYTQVCNLAVAAPGANFGAGISECIQKTNAATCDDFPACAPTTGTLENGAACAHGYQCKSGACPHTSGGRCGTCADKSAIGDDCSGDDDCVDGAACNFGSADRGKCVALTEAGEGESCNQSTQNSIARCKAGLVCNAQLKCATRGAAGAACASSSDCANDLKCVDKKCGDGVAEGGACTNDECAKGLSCSFADDKCVKQKTVNAGEVCDDTRRCARGACKGYDVKYDNGKWDVTPGTCVDPLADGADCSNDENAPPCDAFAECIDGTCKFPDPASCK